MSLSMTVLASKREQEKKWATELHRLVSPWTDLEVAAGAGEDGALGTLVFVDARDEEIWRGVDRRGRALVLICGEKDPVPEALLEHAVDDVLVHPFRLSEVLGKIRHYEQLLMWTEVSRANDTLAHLIDAFHDDLELAARLQKARLPKRFEAVKGFTVTSRYLAGERSGGDYFDLAESPDGKQLSMVLSDSSSYGLSSAVLSSLMGALVRLSADQSRSCREVVRAIYNEVLATLKETDRLSLFYGAVSRKDYELRYLCAGNARAYLGRGGKFQMLPAQAQALGRSQGLGTAEESRIRLEPSDRLILLSDGFLDAAGGESAALELLERFSRKEPKDLLNELVYSVKKTLEGEDALPAQDCSALVFDTDTKLIRLAG